MVNRPSVLVLGSWGAAALIVTMGCAKPELEIRALPDGTRELTCRHPLPQCLSHVDDVCKGASYEVLYATDTQKIFGSPSSSEVESRTSHAVVHCLGPHQKPMAGEPVAAASGAPPPNTTSASPPGVTSAAVTNVPVAPPRVCVPGATQACVGPGGCAGGQACVADGSGFAACDCGAPKTAP